VARSISAMIAAAEGGERSAVDDLYGALYAELHQLARRELDRNGRGVPLGVTTLLHEAYLNLAARDGPAFPDAPRFMAYAARVMRGLIVDHARHRRAQKRGGKFEITALDTEAENAVDEQELVVISDALDDLSKVDQALAETVDLKFFCGLSFAEIAALRGVSERTVQRSWEKARLYLHHTLT
jgi:RNA polymerase sigma factor (TIGR02999 family)